jgi:hypothetical protein
MRVGPWSTCSCPTEVQTCPRIWEGKLYQCFQKNQFYFDLFAPYTSRFEISPFGRNDTVYVS